MATGAEKPPTTDSGKASEEDILREEEEEEVYFGGCCGLLSFRGRSHSFRSENTSLLYGSTDQQQQVREGWWIQKGKSVKQFSEILAGPKWKTFMRRFNHQSNNSKRKSKQDFRYDPQSYALNFDCGGELDEDGDYPDFSGRFASSHLTNGSVHQFGS